MELIYTLLLVEVEILSICAALVLFGWIYEKLHPEYPYCDIDPRCHIAFAWKQDGTGWIGNICVVK